MDFGIQNDVLMYTDIVEWLTKHNLSPLPHILNFYSGNI